MKRFILKILLLTVIVLILFAGLTLLLPKIFKYPILTSSISFDAKQIFIKEKAISHTDIMVLGSSMSLNNLSSETVNARLNNKYTYFNFSSWGLLITDIESLLKLYVTKYTPSCIITVSSPCDFEFEKSFEIPGNSELDNFIKGENYYYLFLKSPQIQRIADRNEKLKISGLIKYDYTSLAYDENGGVTLNVPSDKIDKKRWNRPLFSTTDLQYSALIRICNWLKEKNIKYIFIQSPVKIEDSTEANYETLIKNHCEKVKQIIEQSKFTFINFHDSQKYKKSEFNDRFHLNKNAAERLTGEIFDRINMDSLMMSK
jgi:hypothetical protein